MNTESDTQQVPATPVVAARALLDCFAAGVIRVPGGLMQFQRAEIERELRFDVQILAGVAAEDCVVVALTALACIRHGIETGALVVVRDDAARHVAATIEGVTSMLAAAENASGPLASVWVDAPTVMPHA